MSGSPRAAQLAYSELQEKMLLEQERRRKAARIIAVLEHFTGGGLDGLRALDIGCSAGFIADELAGAGCVVTGCDIDEPGLAKARERFGSRVRFLLGDGHRLPVPDASQDLVVLNHIYEHVVDPKQVVDEIHRVLAPEGVAYLGLGNKYGIMEPHHRLPFLSYLPERAADAYVRRCRGVDAYYERFLSRRGLRTLFGDFHVWDYTVAVLADPGTFASDDLPRVASRLPARALRMAMPLIPTFIWVATKGTRAPAGPGPTPF